MEKCSIQSTSMCTVSQNDLNIIISVHIWLGSSIGYPKSIGFPSLVDEVPMFVDMGHHYRLGIPHVTSKKSNLSILCILL